MTNVQNIEIDEEHITIKYNEKIDRRYNANAITHREWVYKYNDDPEMVLAALRTVIELARKHLYDLPENVACPPGCAECCSGYEPFVNNADVQRIADHFGLTYDEVMQRIRRRARVRRRLQRRLAAQSHRRRRRQVRLPQGPAVGPLLLRHLRGAPARLRCVHADRLPGRRRGRCPSAASTPSAIRSNRNGASATR